MVIADGDARPAEPLRVQAGNQCWRFEGCWIDAEDCVGGDTVKEAAIDHEPGQRSRCRTERTEIAFMKEPGPFR